MAALDPYNQVLGFRKAKHLLRRATFNYSKTTIEELALMTAPQAVSFLLNDPPLKTLLPGDGWTEDPDTRLTHIQLSRRNSSTQAWWWHNMIGVTTLKYKLAYFLHTTFTVSLDSKGFGRGPLFFYDHLRFLNYFAYGNLKTAATKVTLNNAMLAYLDLDGSTAGNPNENYAREFLELFTIMKGKQIGEGDYTNYTEDDVKAASRVLTGFRKNKWVSQQPDITIFDPDTNLAIGYIDPTIHDTSDKTFSAAFNNTVINGGTTEAEILQEFDDFIAMVFGQEETAKAYVRKLYRYFVKGTWTDEVETDVIAPLADELYANNYEIVPTVTKLLSSQHFYDEDDSDNTDEVIGSIVKSPIQLHSEIFSVFDMQYPDPNSSDPAIVELFYTKFYQQRFEPPTRKSGMQMFGPPSVAGYDPYHQAPLYDKGWILATTITQRYRLIDQFISGLTLIDGTALSKIYVEEFVDNNIIDPENATNLVSEIADLLYCESIDSDRVEYFVSILLEEGYSPDDWELAWSDYVATGNKTEIVPRLESLIKAMVKTPEFQLM